MLADECHRQGIKLFFYYSQLDWHNPDYYPRGAPTGPTAAPITATSTAYLDNYMDGQLTELLTNYGPIGGIWFDGMWDKPDADWHLTRPTRSSTITARRADHSQSSSDAAPGEDVQTFERDLPGQNTAGFNTKYREHKYSAGKLRHAQRRMGIQHRRQQLQERRLSSSRSLVRAAGNNSNLLLNIGPYPNGEIDPQFVTRLQAVGEWLSKYGESIYGTRGGPISPADWGVTTQKDNKIYVHVLNWTAPLLALPPIVTNVAGARSLPDGGKIEFTQNQDGVILKLAPPRTGEIDRVVVLTLAK